MKPIIATFFFLLCTSVSFSQNGVLLDSIHQDDYNVISEVFEPEFRELYSYDGFGRRTSILRIMNTGNPVAWIPFFGVDFTYDNRGNNVLTTQTAHNFVMDSFLPYRRYERTFNGMDLPIEETLSTWDIEESDWQYYQRINTVYNVSGDIEMTMEYIYVAFGNVWKPRERIDYFYDVNERHASTVWQNININSNDWENTEKRDFEYDAVSVLDIETVYMWSNNEWIPTDRTEYDFNANDDETLRVQYQWDEATSEWLITTRIIQDYNNDGDWISRQTDRYDPSTMTLIDRRIIEVVELSQTQNVTTTSVWDFNDEIWIPSLRSISTFDQNDGVVSTLEFFDWDVNDSSWIPNFRQTYFWNGTMVNTPIIPFDDQIEIWPNPTDEIISIRAHTQCSDYQITIFNEAGKVVHTDWLSDNSTVRVGHFTSGMYFGLLTCESGAYPIRFVKK